MLTRILRGSLVRRRRRKALSLLAVTLGIAVATAVATISLDIGDKVNRELRSFGANLAVTPAADSIAVTVGGVDFRPAGAGAYLPEDDLVGLKKIFWKNNIVAMAPFVYVPARVGGRNAVLVGSWFEHNLQVDKKEIFRTGLEELHPNWKVEGAWPGDSDQTGCLVGRRLASVLGLRAGQTITLGSEQHGTADLTLSVRGILDTGGPEDEQVLAPLGAVQRWAGLEGKVRRVEVSALTKPEDAFAHSDVTRLNPDQFDRWYCTPYVSSIAYQIQQAIPGASAKPIYPVAETEGRILNQVGVLMWILAIAALATAALAVDSMMLATILERRAEIGLYKSLGATDARVAMLFLLEACVVGLAGGVVGYFAGSGLAWELARSIFGAPTSLHWIMLPAALALALIVTLAGSTIPLVRGMKISPAVVLRD